MVIYFRNQIRVFCAAGSFLIPCWGSYFPEAKASHRLWSDPPPPPTKCRERHKTTQDIQPPIGKKQDILLVFFYLEDPHL